MANEPVEFQFHEVGEISGNTYTGTFAAKPILTFRERALADADRRNFMGNPSRDVQVNELVSDIGLMIAQIRYRTTKREIWAEDLAGLIDENIVIKLFEHVMKIETDYREALKAKAEAAKQALIAPKS